MKKKKSWAFAGLIQCKDCLGDGRIKKLLSHVPFLNVVCNSCYGMGYKLAK